MLISKREDYKLLRLFFKVKVDTTFRATAIDYRLTAILADIGQHKWKVLYKGTTTEYVRHHRQQLHTSPPTR